MKINDLEKHLLIYMILGSFVIFLLIVFLFSFFNQRSIIFLVIILGFLVFFSVIFKWFKNENRNTIDFINQENKSKVQFASKVKYQEKKLYSLNGSSPEKYSGLKKL